MLLGLFAGAFGGRLVAHRYGGAFTLAQRVNPHTWRIISPGLQLGIGRAGAGRVTHVREGALSIATHVFFRPDMVVPIFKGKAHRVEVGLAEDSGDLWIQMGDPPGQFVRLRPGAYASGKAGAAWISAPGVRDFILEVKGPSLMLKAGEQVFNAGSVGAGRVELSSAEGWPRVTHLKIEDATGAVLFSENFDDLGASADTLAAGTILGAIVGLALTMLCFPFSVGGLGVALAGITPIAFVLGRPMGTWLDAVERLYLSAVTPSSFASIILVLSAVPLCWAAVVSALRWLAPGMEGRTQGWRAWWVVGAASMAAGVFHSGGSILAISVVCVVMLFGALRAGKMAPDSWWWMDLLGWTFVAIGGPDVAAPFVVAWRLATVVATAGAWLRRGGARRAVDVLLLTSLAFPLALEAAVRSSDWGSAWVMSRLSGERPNERGWENPSAGWTGECGDGGAKSVTMVVAGGSSVGGAYQFGDEPEAFFTAAAHRALCASLPSSIRLTTHNFGDGDLNTFTIARTIEDHLKDADILVLYVGVNDLLTTQNTQTRKQRETAAAKQGAVANRLSGLASDLRLMVAASVWFRGVEDPMSEEVPDVPLADAQENHEAIINAARAKGKRVVLMTEHVQSGLLDRMSIYRNMQRSFQAQDVRWLDAKQAFASMAPADVLADRNHLSRAGNTALGEFLAEGVSDWVYGSSR
jgi:lysophospholipase L1-like esterase